MLGIDEGSGMRPRDARAIGFCAVTIVALAAVSFGVSQNYLVALGLTAAYAAFVLTRPRMLRVYRRLRGEPDWGGYFKDD
jgi:hypothetical protein